MLRRIETMSILVGMYALLADLHQFTHNLAVTENSISLCVLSTSHGSLEAERADYDRMVSGPYGTGECRSLAAVRRDSSKHVLGKALVWWEPYGHSSWGGLRRPGFLFYASSQRRRDTIDNN